MNLKSINDFLERKIFILNRLIIWENESGRADVMSHHVSEKYLPFHDHHEPHPFPTTRIPPSSLASLSQVLIQTRDACISCSSSSLTVATHHAARRAIQAARRGAFCSSIYLYGHNSETRTQILSPVDAAKLATIQHSILMLRPLDLVGAAIGGRRCNQRSRR